MESEAKSEEVALGDLLDQAKRRCLRKVINALEPEVAVAYSQAYASLSIREPQLSAKSLELLHAIDSTNRAIPKLA